MASRVARVAAGSIFILLRRHARRVQQLRRERSTSRPGHADLLGLDGWRLRDGDGHEHGVPARGRRGRALLAAEPDPQRRPMSMDAPGAARRVPERRVRRANGSGDCVGKGQWGNDPDGIAEPLVNASTRCRPPRPRRSATNGRHHERRSMARTVTGRDHRDGDRERRHRRHPGRLRGQRSPDRDDDTNGGRWLVDDMGYAGLARGVYTLEGDGDRHGRTDARATRSAVGTGVNVQGSWVPQLRR